MTETEKILLKNFQKICNWIKDTFPHAIERSTEKRIDCKSKHHVYHDDHIEIKNGEVYLFSGSWGGRETSHLVFPNGKIYSGWGSMSEAKNVKLTVLENFIHEWSEQKSYIIASLKPYEDIYTFEI